MSKIQMVEGLLEAFDNAISAGGTEECAKQFLSWVGRVGFALSAAGMIDEHKIWDEARTTIEFYDDEPSFPAQAESMKSILVGILGRLNEEESTELQAMLERGHPNISSLVRRMNHALTKGDYSAVLHSSASIFETLAKVVVGIPSIQDQTLKSFFDRYRKDSTLPDEILDYILAIYESRNSTPLAGHGSTQTPDISRTEAVVLAEITKAFVRIEYILRENRT